MACAPAKASNLRKPVGGGKVMPTPLFFQIGRKLEMHTICSFSGVSSRYQSFHRLDTG